MLPLPIQKSVHMLERYQCWPFCYSLTTCMKLCLLTVWKKIKDNYPSFNFYGGSCQSGSSITKRYFHQHLVSTLITCIVDNLLITTNTTGINDNPVISQYSYFIKYISITTTKTKFSEIKKESHIWYPHVEPYEEHEMSYRTFLLALQYRYIPPG